MPPQRLCVEVTERVFLGRSADGVAIALQKLHDIGVEIALDDFGTGFGSLSHLKKLPIDRLKVDRSFVRDMETNPDNMAIVRTITHLGQSLGIKVTVEGVEIAIAVDAAARHGLRHHAGLSVLQAHACRTGCGLPRYQTRPQRLIAPTKSP